MELNNRQMRDAVHLQTDTMAQSCENINNLRDTLEAAEVHYSIVAALDAAITAASTACNQLNHAEALLRQAAQS